MIRRTMGFQLVQIADEFVAVSLEENEKLFKGVVALNEEAYYMLSNITSPKTIEDLVHIITSEYEVEEAVARADLESILPTLFEVGLIEEVE